MNISLKELSAAIKTPGRSLRDCQRTARAAGLATAGSAAVCGAVEDGSPAAPVNAIAHIAFGEEAFRQTQPSLKYTLTGLLLNDSAMVSWAALHEMFFGRAKDEGNLKLSLLGGGLVSLLAYLTDYHFVPERLKPGFEKHLMPRSLVLIHVVLALTLGLADARRRRR